MPNAREVAAYLKKNPEFFAKRRDLLAAMKLPEDADAAPFHARQVQALRDREAEQQARFDSMLDTARNNQDLELGLHEIAVTLMSQTDIDPSDPAAPAVAVKARFDIDEVAIFLASRSPDSIPRVDYPLLCRRVEHLGSVCDDRVSRKLSATLFPRTAAITSCAFIPLTRARKLGGVMVLGAADPRRFQPGMGVVILDRLGQLLSAYLAGRDLF